MNAQSLYQEVILDHNRKPRHFGAIADATHRAEGVNPLCGDHLWISVKITEARLAEIGFQGDSCAICRASASMMTIAVKGRDTTEVRQLAEAFRALATGHAEPDQVRLLGRLAVFSGVARLPGRVKCAVLPWHTLMAALSGERCASSEGAAGPVSDGLAC
ncbi:NifU-like protein [compost metagenome]